jgi:hypothetical protein
MGPPFFWNRLNPFAEQVGTFRKKGSVFIELLLEWAQI